MPIRGTNDAFASFPKRQDKAAFKAEMEQKYGPRDEIGDEESEQAEAEEEDTCTGGPEQIGEAAPPASNGASKGERASDEPVKPGKDNKQPPDVEVI